MNTTFQVGAVNLAGNHAKTESISKNVSLSNIWQKAEFSRFGIICVLLILSACIGGVAAAVAVQHSIALLGFVAMSTVFIEALILAVTPMRTIILSAFAFALMHLLIIVFI